VSQPRPIRAAPEIGQRYVKMPGFGLQRAKGVVLSLPVSLWTIVHLYTVQPGVKHAVLRSSLDGTLRTISCAELCRGKHYREA
jgi:hypothetical protein